MSYQKSSEMPDPQTMDYRQHYRVTSLFVNDLKKVLADVAYVDAQPFFKKIEECNGIMCISAVNELIRSLGCLPYKYVNTIMRVINNSENFVKYFEPLPIPEQNQQTTKDSSTNKN